MKCTFYMVITAVLLIFELATTKSLCSANNRFILLAVECTKSDLTRSIAVRKDRAVIGMNGRRVFDLCEYVVVSM